MLKTKLIGRLKEYKQNGKIFSVKWDGGGDETIINFYLENEVIPDYEDEVLTELAGHLVEVFDLPNAGEYYNEGKGTISLDDKNQILIVYDEFAYGEKYDEEIESEKSIEEFSIPSSEECKKILENMNEISLNFYGSTSFLSEISDDFEISSARFDKTIKKEKLLEVQKEIKKNALAKFEPPFDASEIGYSGKIDENQITFEELYQIKYFVDKHNKEATKILFA